MSAEINTRYNSLSTAINAAYLQASASASTDSAHRTALSAQYDALVRRVQENRDYAVQQLDLRCRGIVDAANNRYDEVLNKAEADYVTALRETRQEQQQQPGPP